MERQSTRSTFDEIRRERWGRRFVSGPLLLLMTVVVVVTLPLSVPVALVVDLLRRRRWSTVRFVCATVANLLLHVVGFFGMFGCWLLGGRWAGAGPTRERSLEQRLQVWWAGATWKLSARIYGMRLVVDGELERPRGATLMLVRHASLLDTLLPLVLFAESRGRRLRYVMKRELMWDPILDALGHRWPTAFVRRGAGDPHQLELVSHLVDGIDHDDAIVLFPEGTRATAEKRARVLASLANKDPEAHRRALEFDCVLPPRPGGVLALLDAGVALEVLFVAHRGLEGANHFSDLLAGALVGATVSVQSWRVPAEEVPREAEERWRWLHEQWRRVDRFVAADAAVGDEGEGRSQREDEAR